MKDDFIKIRGAKVHNLKNINVDIPRNKLVVITGISGSGKSSLAFDTLYAEGQRRYVESLSSYARQFLDIMDKPCVEKIEGISPTISINQRKVAHNPRSTVGTITEIYDYLRLLFTRIGKPHCPKCKRKISCQSVDRIVEQILGLNKESEITILGPVIRFKKGEHQGTLKEIQRAGFVRVRIDGIIYRLEEAIDKTLDINKKHNIEVVVDKLIIKEDLPSTTFQEDSLGKRKTQKVVLGLDKPRLTDSLEIGLRIGKGIVIISQKSKVPEGKPSASYGAGKSPRTIPPRREARGRQKSKDLLFSEYFACEKCGVSLSELEPRLFSFNSPKGACPVCMGLGEKLEIDPKLIIPNENLTIAEGAISPWAWIYHRTTRQSYLWQQFLDLAEKYNFSLDEPVKNLSKKNLDIIFYGDENFEGVVSNLERKYYETASQWTRSEIKQYMVIKKCPKCLGKRLKPEVLAITVAGKSIDEVVEMSIYEAKNFFENFFESRIKTRALNKLSARPSTQIFNLSALDQESRKKNKKSIHNSKFLISDSDFRIAQPIIKEIINRLQFLIDVGLDYLTLDRKAATLAGGEEQRIRLATQIGSKLFGVLYILDEPSVGLHSRDQERLIQSLKKLRDLGNTVIIVEHEYEIIISSDRVINIGPGAGKDGGKVVFQGTPRQLARSKTLTGEYLSGRKKVEAVIEKFLSSGSSRFVRSAGAKAKQGSEADRQENYLAIKGAQEHNLKNIDVKIPLGRFVCVTGVSGSGKSSLIDDILAKALLKQFYRAKEEPGKFKKISGTKFLNKVVLVDQSPIGKTPKSNPATYTGAFFFIRELFSKNREAKIRGYSPGHFSFNVKGGRCEACEGQGQIKVEMYFLPDVYVECKECKGKRYSKEALEIEYKGKNIAEVLEMTVEEAAEFFKNIPSLFQKLKTLKEVGLSYVKLAQPAPFLSGGEAQRVKLATELSRKSTGNTIYILDEPTTGLHPDDIKKLISVLRKLVEKGNTVLSTEHNLDFIRCTDWCIDLGPEGGKEGGYIVAEGTPDEIAKIPKSYTGRFLKKRFFK